MDALRLLEVLQEHVEQGKLTHSGIFSNKDLGHMIWNARVELERLRAVPPFDLVAHLYRQRAFSEATFGPGPRTAGVLTHIRKELVEIEDNPADLVEWVDVILLALDGAWRAGHSPELIVAAIAAKQSQNEARTWPDWRSVPPDAAIEHVRAGGATADPDSSNGMTVVLADYGQDFLEFDIKDGRIVETRPFQGDVWNGMPVLNETIQPGDHIVVRTHHHGVHTFRYQVIAVRQMEG